MPGKTGKRAKLPTPCVECGLKISGAFARDGKRDFHRDCWQEWWDRKNGKGEMKLDLDGVTSRSLLPVEERRIGDGVKAVALAEPQTKGEATKQIEQLLDGARALQSLDDLGVEANNRIDKAMKWLIAKADRLKTKNF